MAGKDQRIELLERSQEDTKENLNRIQENSMATLKSAMANFENEKNALVNKIESNNDETNKKQILNFQMQQKLDNLKSNAEREINEQKRINLEAEKEIIGLKDKLHKRNYPSLKMLSKRFIIFRLLFE